MTATDITIETINVTSSTLKSGDSGIVIDVSGATANLSMNWQYSYSSWWLPVSVSDKGNATIQVEGLEVGLTLSLETVEGALKVSLLDCGCYVNGISIKLNGGASWLYQWLVDAFEDKISSAVEDAIPKKIKDAIVKLDNALQYFPKEVSVTSIAALNITLVGDPALNELSLDLEIDGLLSAKDEATLSSPYHRIAQESERDGARKMHWIVDKVPDQSLLNTAGWRFIIPQLYKRYPNDDMSLNLTVSSPPTIEVEKRQIKAKIPLDVVIDVLDVGQVVPVVCISVVIDASVSPEILGNTLVGVAKLNEFTMSLNWSKIGDLHMYLVQTLVSATLRTLVLLYVNLKLTTGYQIPPFHGYELQYAQLLCTDAWIVICSDVAPAKQYNLI
ncbi:hypothetical protein SASPL_154458 [Salvia splendens]|uniref:Lipid-binding serum glycoprotein C-terminal domain-containing protein n=1 Tax=Salvia splendens TaxID=180675 RepID=A0A8X8YZU6_SALSN|nr:hypothetical protein SASPL_154458 [Salvia splendens]